jgi:hypothetical protein
VDQGEAIGRREDIMSELEVRAREVHAAWLAWVESGCEDDDAVSELGYRMRLMVAEFSDGPLSETRSAAQTS